MLVLLTFAATSASAALTISNKSYENAGSESKIEFDLAFDSSYATGGESLTPEMLGLSRINRVKIMADSGYMFEYDNANEKVLVYNAGISSHNHTFTGTALATDTVTVTDDDTAATNGTAVYVGVKDGKMEEGMLFSENANGSTVTVETTDGLETFVLYKAIDPEVIEITDDDAAASNGSALYVRPTGHGNISRLVSDNSNDANSSFVTISGGSTVPVYYDANAAYMSSPVYLDEDGTDGSRILAASPTLHDQYVQATDGRWIKITHNDNPAGSGVQVYFDDDGADTDDRLLFVSPTNANATNTNDSAAAFSAAEDWVLTKVYVDEDGTAGQKFMQAASAAVDIPIVWVDDSDPTATVRLQTVAYASNAASLGVQLYIDDNGATESERLLFVSPTNADTTDALNASLTYYGSVAAGSVSTAAGAVATEVVAATNLSTLTGVKVEAYGK